MYSNNNNNNGGGDDGDKKELENGMWTDIDKQMDRPK